MKGVAEKRREGIWAAENLWVVLVCCTVYCGADLLKCKFCVCTEGGFIYLLGTNVCYCHSKEKNDILFKIHSVFGVIETSTEDSRREREKARPTQWLPKVLLLVCMCFSPTGELLGYRVTFSEAPLFWKDLCFSQAGQVADGHRSWPSPTFYPGHREGLFPVFPALLPGLPIKIQAGLAD